MEKIRFYIAWMSAKLVGIGLELVGSLATSLPGLVAMRISPRFLKHIRNYVKKDVLTITGTNGKTTTAGIFAHILADAGLTSVHNEKGANMLTGVVTAFARQVSPFEKKDYFVLESDEAYLRKLYDDMKADYLLVTNLFRDQLDRYGELNKTASLIQEAINKNKELKVFLNIDDPLVSLLAEDNKRIYFGMEDVELVDAQADSGAPQELVKCPCGEPFAYTKRFYSHLGHYVCECGFQRGEADYSGSAKVYSDHSELTVSHKDVSHKFKIFIPGLYNVYNALGAISMALELGVEPQVIQNSLDTYTAVFGRAQKLSKQGKEVFIQLIKNPVGASEALRGVSAYKNKNLLVMLNDNYADGRDVSWIWDANFEAIKDYKGKIYISGTRALDMALRLKHVFGTDENLVIIDDVKKAFETALEQTAEYETLVVLPTYTALLKMQPYLN